MLRLLAYAVKAKSRFRPIKSMLCWPLLSESGTRGLRATIAPWRRNPRQRRIPTAALVCAGAVAILPCSVFRRGAGVAIGRHWKCRVPLGVPWVRIPPSPSRKSEALEGLVNTGFPEPRDVAQPRCPGSVQGRFLLGPGASEGQAPPRRFGVDNRMGATFLPRPAPRDTPQGEVPPPRSVLLVRAPRP